jgi:hypothetical protein
VAGSSSGVRRHGVLSHVELGASYRCMMAGVTVPWLAVGRSVRHLGGSLFDESDAERGLIP